jgi:hypothetical protein
VSAWQIIELVVFCFGAWVVALMVACVIVVVLTERKYKRPARPAGIAAVGVMTTYPTRKTVPVKDAGQQLADLERRIQEGLS